MRASASLICSQDPRVRAPSACASTLGPSRRSWTFAEDDLIRPAEDGTPLSHPGRGPEARGRCLEPRAAHARVKRLFARLLAWRR